MLMFPTKANSTCWFAGHETFSLRHSWLPKAVKYVREQPDLFQADDALVTLGVGKNMVRSIRHWAIATGVLAEGEPRRGSRVKPIRITRLGEFLFGPKGADRFLEDPATLWLLHWRLASTTDGPTTWHWAFNEYAEAEFTKDRLLTALKLYVDRSDFRRVADSSLNADTTCLIRSYVSSSRHRAAVLEDTLDCPFTELSLIHELDDGVLRFNRGEHPSLPTSVVAFAALEYWDRIATHKGTMTFDQLAYQPGSPGRVFKLTEDALAEHLEVMEKLTEKAITYDVTAGLRQVYRRKPVNPDLMLQKHYSFTGARLK